MTDLRKREGRLFDPWPDRYDAWFETPIGKRVKGYESALLLDLLQPRRGENILDAGCGTGVFTLDFLSFGPCITGLEISLPMLMHAMQKVESPSFRGVAGDMMSLPFAGEVFDKVVSVTALEFIEDARSALTELFRVTRRGGVIVVATLNSLSPWADRRRRKAGKGHDLFQRSFFRSPDEMRSLAPIDGVLRTAVHFSKDEDPAKVAELETQGRERHARTGAFLAVRWHKP